MKQRFRYCPGGLALLLLFFSAGLAAAPVNSGNVEAELISEVEGVVPGEAFWIVLRQEIRPDWHTYWRNPGDSGAPTTLTWDLPAGFVAGAIEWPYPERVPYGPLMNYGYHGEVFFPVRVEVPGELDGDSVTLRAKGRWLVCADICIPENADLELTLPVVSSAMLDESVADIFMMARQRVPQALGLDATWQQTPGGIEITLPLANADPARLTDVSYFPYTEALIENPAPQAYRYQEGSLVITVQPGYEYTPDASFGGIIVISEDAGEAVSTAFEISPVGAGVVTGSEPAGVDLLTAILFALLGGLILNLMPCVFPVLSIKILSLVQHVGSHSSEIRLHGWVYLAGVVASFVGVAVVLIALRAGGAQIGWGFQLQSPLVVTLLAYLFFVIGLNLFGLFEIGATLMNIGQGKLDERGLSTSFLTGVLATVVAAPCTVPFMATAVGFALTQDSVVALSVFAALGVGMALPYLVLCYSPALMDRLPRPGAWMVRFRELLSFAMFGSAAWLVWVLSQQTGSMGVLASLVGMLLIAFGIWLLVHRPSQVTGRMLVTITAVLLVAAALYLPTTLRGGAPATGTSGVVTSVDANYEGPAFQSYSAATLSEYVADGPVFVNFTAAWCITCKVNETVALDSAVIRDAFAAADVRYLKGDWTNEDPAITAALAEYQRSGVPLYLLYAKGASRATVLPQVLTESIVLRAVESL